MKSNMPKSNKIDNANKTSKIDFKKSHEQTTIMYYSLNHFKNVTTFKISGSQKTQDNQIENKNKININQTNNTYAMETEDSN